MSNFSYLAIWAILKKEIREFLKEFQFNIVSPLVTTILFVFILSTLDKHYNFGISSDSYINFLTPGVIMTVIMQVSFNHLSEVIISMKQNGSFNDYLMAPISRSEIFISFILSSVIVCLLVAFINIFFLSFFVIFDEIHLLMISYYLILSILAFSSMGAVIGFLSYTWDVQSSVRNFFIFPLSFLSGTFFSMDMVNPQFKLLFVLNPFYHLVDGFRKSFYYGENISLFYNIYILIFVCIFFLSTLFIFKKGYRVIS